MSTKNQISVQIPPVVLAEVTEKPAAQSLLTLRNNQKHNNK